VEGNTNDNVVSLSRKAAANRRNAQLSTRPRTEEGKSRSRLNAVKHGILASAVLITAGEGAEDPAEFEELLSALRRDLAPVGRLEEMMVEKIAVYWWRQKRVLSCEVGLVRRAFVPNLNDQRLEARWISQGRFVPTPELVAIKDHFRLPLSDNG
jgi:hypothetical protein